MAGQPQQMMTIGGQQKNVIIVTTTGNTHSKWEPMATYCFPNDFINSYLYLLLKIPYK